MKKIYEMNNQDVDMSLLIKLSEEKEFISITKQTN
jgi:hypothetical protein